MAKLAHLRSMHRCYTRRPVRAIRRADEEEPDEEGPQQGYFLLTSHITSDSTRLRIRQVINGK